MRLIDENRWAAKRFGIDATFIDLDGGPPRPCREVLAQLCDDVAEDAQVLGCEVPLADVARLMDEGSSARAQLARYEAARAEGQPRAKALQAVVDWLVEQTVPTA